MTESNGKHTDHILAWALPFVMLVGIAAIISLMFVTPVGFQDTANVAIGGLIVVMKDVAQAFRRLTDSRVV